MTIQLGATVDGREQKEWMTDAACTQTDPSMFVLDEGHAARYTNAARAICAACPVRVACLQYALDNNIRDGLYGGLSERERRRLRGAAA